MESTDSLTGGGGPSQQPSLPPGFRFHPTDEELVVHYLKKKATSVPLPVPIIADVDIYKFDPWQLPVLGVTEMGFDPIFKFSAKATFGEQEWYFFSPRDRKYPNGARPNRAATSGYWKATGIDKPILTSGGTQRVGVKKALVFYGGKPPKGIKTNWIMHEYRLVDSKASNKPPSCVLGNKKMSKRLDDWVLCRIYKKNNSHRPMDPEKDDQSMEDVVMNGSIPPSISIGNQNRIHISKGYGGALQLESHEHHQSFLEGILMNNNDHGNVKGSSSIDHEQLASSTSKPMELPMLPTKRILPCLYNWTEEIPGGRSLSEKRLEGDNGNVGSTSTSIATLLSQFQTQTSQLHQQAILGSLEDGIFRQPQTYQLPGMNWYSN